MDVNKSPSRIPFGIVGSEIPNNNRTCSRNKGLVGSPCKFQAAAIITSCRLSRVVVAAP
jgi:hypothetical protein